MILNLFLCFQSSPNTNQPVTFFKGHSWQELQYFHTFVRNIIMEGQCHCYFCQTVQKKKAAKNNFKIQTLEGAIFRIETLQDAAAFVL